ncbi:MAG: fatty acyl-AMP ligase [Actinomycetota bacterium]|nr:fatty acyl-AMP ligase [Actinomycetota bacterium]
MSSAASPDLGRRARSFGDLLQRRADSAPSATAVVFLEDDGSEYPLTYAELHRRASDIAAAIEAGGNDANEPVLLLFPPGPDYVAALFGCFYAGAPAVPAYPPIPTRMSRTLPRLLAIFEDSAAGAVLTIGALREVVEQWFQPSGDTAPPRVIATDELARTEGGRASAGVAPDTLALLQYTSGTTSSPRGVMLTHEHLLSNCARVYHSLGISAEDSAVIWLPPYHDLGLIGGIMQSVYAPMSCVLMSPMTFLRRPIVWLREMSRNRATTTGGPNFAYDLCVRRTTPEEREGLDLSNWEIAFTGAEPVSAQTIEDFSRTFAPYGFRREAFYPCYGLAEATLIVSGGTRMAGPKVIRVNRDRLEGEGVAETTDDPARVLVGCGTLPSEHRAVIVDPSSLRARPEGHVGEIWFSSPSVAAGYWRKPLETQAVFEAVTSDTGEGPFLRTGDLGFVLDGEVFVTGRLKDVMVINGRNYHPEDIEKACEAAVAGLRPSCGAVFGVHSDSGPESMVVVYEVAGEDADDHADTLEAIRRTVSMDVNVQPEAVVLIQPRTLPKTSSGKIQRFLCREQYFADELDVVARWDAPRRASR